MSAAVLFDLDGTLLDHEGAARAGARAWAAGENLGHGFDGQALGSEWLRLEDEHYANYLAGTLSFQEQRRARLAGMLAILGCAVPPDIAPDRLFEAYLRHYEAAWRAYEDVLPFTVASSLVALMGGWVVFALTWPFVYLRRTRDPADDRRGWTWTAAPNWPTPPTGFVPASGWTADTAWPPAPRGHVFWHRTRRGQWQRRPMYGAAALSLLVPSGLIVGSVVVGPCFFDPPPGDQTSLQVTNDSGTDVAVVDCLDDRCRTAQSRTSIPMGAQAAMPLEGCAGGTMGVLDPRSDQLLNCIPEPTEEGDGGLRDVVISEGRPCSSPRNGERVRVVSLRE